MYKRYQYWSKDGIVWTDWFKCTFNRETTNVNKKLKVEYDDRD